MSFHCANVASHADDNSKRVMSDGELFRYHCICLFCRQALKEYIRHPTNKSITVAINHKYLNYNFVMHITCSQPQQLRHNENLCRSIGGMGGTSQCIRALIPLVKYASCLVWQTCFSLRCFDASKFVSAEATGILFYTKFIF